MASEDLELFISSGIDKKRAEEALKNNNLREALRDVLTQARAVEGCPMKEVVNMLYTVACTLPAAAVVHRPLIVKYIASKKIGKTNFQEALDFLKKIGGDPLSTEDFEKECGVGVVVTAEQIKKGVSEVIESQKAAIVEERYHYPLMNIMAPLKTKLKFADSKLVKDEVDAQLKALLGERTAADNEKPKKKEVKKEKETKPAVDNNAEPAKEVTVRFPDPQENKQKIPEILKKHLEATGGRVICRFPPEPNGYLHIGHAKAMNLNFTYPKKSKGETYLRYDDTNPEAESIEYIRSIEEDVRWLGHNPQKITYASDYFQDLYDLAVELIKRGKAYVDHQTPEEIAEGREKRIDSPWRNRPIEESLKLFEDMRKGKLEEGSATLRMKMDMQSENPVMRDLIAYRIKYHPHPHAGDKWCIYPSYDYTHCINDSLENITHSLCTLEFERRRESYFWLLDALDLYKPVVWEYSRLNITHTVLSKRKLIKLVTGGYVRGWDDPRMPTIRGIRRRGYPPQALNDFCERVGVTRTYNIIDIGLLEECCREYLDTHANRSMVITDPLKVVITNFEGETRQVSVQNHPKNSEKGSHTVPLSKVVYIERSDFREQDIKGYKRLAPGKEVGLMHAGWSIKCTDIVKDASGNIIELKAEINWNPDKKQVGGFIHWVSEPAPGKDPVKIELRMYDVLFKSAEPGKLEDWLGDLNPDSLRVIYGFADPSINNYKVEDHLQFERVGYFFKDQDSTTENAVWNRTVALKQAKWEKETTNKN
mmetsp:Transcript_3801/g.5308  ORF Transcript_3801/g.5308 Transcript_3801/m.5308 type:complete len:764 (+) Transcript_3801:110-2401(+)